MNKIILVSGKAESGKTLTSNIIKSKLESLGYRVLIVSFASYLKFISEKYFKWDGKKDENGRSLLQHLGTNVVRKKNPDFWVKTVYDFVYTFENEFDYFIADDTRFKNEISYFQERDPFSYFSIRVERIDFENSLTTEQRKHDSEVDLDDWSFDLYLESKSGYENLSEIVNHRMFMNEGIRRRKRN